VSVINQAVAGCREIIVAGSTPSIRKCPALSVVVPYGTSFCAPVRPSALHLLEGLAGDSIHHVPSDKHWSSG
jgi:hypothetical protein